MTVAAMGRCFSDLPDRRDGVKYAFAIGYFRHTPEVHSTHATLDGMDNTATELEALIRRAEASVSMDRLSREEHGGSGIVAGLFADALRADDLERLGKAISALSMPSGNVECSIGMALGSARRAVMLGEDARPFMADATRHLDYLDHH